MLKCAICGCTDFYKESGYFFCMTCQTQSQDAGQEVQLELPIDNVTRLRRTRIHRVKSERTDELGWTSWELYNFVMVGLTHELIDLGASADIKVTVLQLWARYLGKLEVAFVSTKRRLIPKLSRRFKKRDAEIIYGKVLSEKRQRKRKKTESNVTGFAASTCHSEEAPTRELNRNKQLMITADYDRYVQSQTNSEGETLSMYNQSVYSFQSSSARSSDNQRVQFSTSARKETKNVKGMARKLPRQKRDRYVQSHMTTQYKTGPGLITPTKLWAILYLALRIHNQDIHLGDMIRYLREGHLSYYKLDHLIPPEVTLTRNDVNFLSRATDITHKGMRRIIGRMAEFLGVTEIICPHFLSFVTRYCNELHLPRGISLYAERLIALSPPKMEFDRRKSCIPNYEGRAMAFIIVVMKTLLSLDGVTEYEISRVAAKINSTEGVQVDASIIDGSKSECGSVLAVSSIEHPISLARHVLHCFPNTVVVGEGARRLARDARLDLLSEDDMVAPAAYRAYRSHKTDDSDASSSCIINQQAEALERSKPLTAIDNDGIGDSKLFDFCEWQRYIECRRAVLVNAHYPTKLRHNPGIPDVNSLYIKLLQSIKSRTDSGREEPEIITYKHLIPRELVRAMRQCIGNIDYIDLPLNEVNEFPASLTPHRSYLQQLSDHPLWDLPSVLRNDFPLAKVGYMTKPDLICKLAVQYDVPLDIVDTNLHFVEKTVPFFEQAKLASTEELKDKLEIHDSLEETVEMEERKESFVEYLHRKIPCQLRINARKKQYYDSIRKKIVDTRAPLLPTASNEFAFDEVLPDGKLSIPDNKIDGNESVDDDDNACSGKNVPREIASGLSAFCETYDIGFSSTEREALLGNSRPMKKCKKRKPTRNAQGKFVKQDDAGRDAESPNDEDDENYEEEDEEEQIEMALAEDDLAMDDSIPEIPDILNMNDNLSNRFDDLLKTEHDEQIPEGSRATFKSASDDSPLVSRPYDDTIIRLCRPFADYWMYHCNFSRVKPKNFELFEKMLPRSFRWLLNECADVVEMSTEDLYEEVCLVEAYHTYISEQLESCADGTPPTRGNRAHVNAVLSKW